MAQPSDDTFAAMDRIIWQHLEERDWDKPTPRSLAISLSLEANELLEHYQWQDEPIGDKAALAEELADVLMYALQFAHLYGIDPAEAIRDKLAKSDRKYPAADFKGKTRAEQTERWLQAKTEHRQHKSGL